MFNFFRKKQKALEPRVNFTAKTLLQELRLFLISEIYRLDLDVIGVNHHVKQQKYREHLASVEKKLKCSDIHPGDALLELCNVSCTAQFVYRVEGFRSFFGLPPKSASLFHEVFGDSKKITKNVCDAYKIAHSEQYAFNPPQRKYI